MSSSALVNKLLAFPILRSAGYQPSKIKMGVTVCLIIIMIEHKPAFEKLPCNTSFAIIIVVLSLTLKIDNLHFF